MTRTVTLVVLCSVIAAVGGFVLGNSGSADAEHAHHSTDATTLSDQDIEWARAMAAHHEQAVLFTQNLADDADPQVMILARRIESAQMKEIGELRGWLRLVGASQVMGHANGADPHAEMPGMATWEEIDRLRTAVGVDADVTFLQLMTRHHRGGVDMAVDGARATRSDAVRAVATAMVVDQSGEIEVMAGMLMARGAEPLPYP